MNEPPLPAHLATDADDPPSAADALAIIQHQQAHAAASLTPNLVVLYGAWGLAWIVGFAAFYVIEAGILAVPLAVAGIVMFAVFVLATVISIVHSVRSGRGIRGPSDRAGAMYGFSWTISMLGMGLLLGGVSRLGLPDEVASLIFPAAFVFVTGVMYLFGGTLWKDLTQYGLGTWLIAVAGVSTFVGSPGNLLVLAIGGGGGLLAIAGYHATRARAAR